MSERTPQEERRQHHQCSRWRRLRPGEAHQPAHHAAAAGRKGRLSGSLFTGGIASALHRSCRHVGREEILQRTSRAASCPARRKARVLPICQPLSPDSVSTSRQTSPASCGAWRANVSSPSHGSRASRRHSVQASSTTNGLFFSFLYAHTAIDRLLETVPLVHAATGRSQQGAAEASTKTA